MMDKTKSQKFKITKRNMNFHKNGLVTISSSQAIKVSHSQF